MSKVNAGMFFVQSRYCPDWACSNGTESDTQHEWSQLCCKY